MWQQRASWPTTSYIIQKDFGKISGLFEGFLFDSPCWSVPLCCPSVVIDVVFSTMRSATTLPAEGRGREREREREREGERERERELNFE